MWTERLRTHLHTTYPFDLVGDLAIMAQMMNYQRMTLTVSLHVLITFHVALSHIHTSTTCMDMNGRGEEDRDIVVDNSVTLISQHSCQIVSQLAYTHTHKAAFTHYHAVQVASFLYYSYEIL